MDMDWQPIPGYAGYEATLCGRVRSIERAVVGSNQYGSFPRLLPGCELVQTLDSKGYPSVSVQGGTMRVHRLVALTFLPKPEGEWVVNHKDSNRANNHVSNLEWCNTTYNNVHAVEEGKYRPAFLGSETPWSILKETDVEEILKLKSSMSQQKIADRYGVKQVTISNIYTGRSWAWFTGITPTPRSRKRPAPVVVTVTNS